MELDHVGALVQRALDEFDDHDLSIAGRRAYRIARLRGDVAMAHRLHFEIRPIGGSHHDRHRVLEALYPGLSHDELQARHDEVLEEWMVARTPTSPISTDPDRRVLAGSIAQLIFAYRHNEQVVEEARRHEDWKEHIEALETLGSRQEIFERIRSLIFDYLVRVEAQLEASDTVSSTLARHRRAVDHVLDEAAPDLRDQLQAALRTARQEGGEHRSQVLVTCRRVLVAIADHLYPAADEPHVSADGTKRPVGKGQYRNRILAAVEDNTAGSALGSAIADLATRLDHLDQLTQKGVHDEVTEAEMEFGLAQTYFLAGELLRPAPGAVSTPQRPER